MDDAIEAVFKQGGNRLLYEYDKHHVVVQMGDLSVVDMEAEMGVGGDPDVCQVSMRSVDMGTVPDEVKSSGCLNLVKVEGGMTLNSHDGGEGEMSLKVTVQTAFDEERTEALPRDRKVESAAAQKEEETKKEEEEEEEVRVCEL